MLTRCALLHCDLKAVRMNMQQSNLGTYALRVQTGSYTMKVTKTIKCVKGKGTFDHSQQMILREILLGLQERRQSSKVRLV